MAEGECFESSIKIASYVEIYNELIFDLMDSSGTTLQIREDAKKGTFVHGAVEREVKCYSDAYSVSYSNQLTRLDSGRRNSQSDNCGNGNEPM
jgi:hypothetical protein